MAVQRLGALERVERLADAAVAEAVDVHLEAGLVEGADDAAQRDRVDEGEAGVGRRVPAPVEVGLDEGRGPVLRDAVLHDLDRGRGEPPVGVRRPLLDQLGDLLQPALALPPQRPDHRGHEVARAGGAQVGRPGVLHAGVRTDDRVLPAGDAEREQVALALEQPRVELVGRRRREHREHQAHRALVQHAGRLARGVALDAAVGRVGGVAR